MLNASRRFAAIFLLFSLLSVCRAGVVYRAEMEKFGRKSSFEVWATDATAKFSVLKSDDPSMPAGMAIIALDQGARYEILIPSKDAYVELTREQFKNLRRKQSQNASFEFQDGKVEELVVDEDGGKVAGIQTRHYKLRISVSGAEQGEKIHAVAIEDFWTAPSILNPAPALDMLTEQVTGISKLDSLMHYEKFQGYPLRRLVEVSINGQPAGTSLVEVQSILNQPVSDSVFEIPANYKKLEMPGP
jgi:hypothetical protein